MTIVLNGVSLTIEKLVDVARNRKNVKVSIIPGKKSMLVEKCQQN